MAGTTSPAQAATGVAADVAATGRNLSAQPNAVRWFSIVAMFAIALAFVYLVLRFPAGGSGAMTAAEFQAALAARDALVRPSTDPSVQALAQALENIRAELSSLRADLKAAEVVARTERTQLEGKIDRQAERTDRALELLVALSDAGPK